VTPSGALGGRLEGTLTGVVDMEPFVVDL